MSCSFFDSTNATSHYERVVVRHRYAGRGSVTVANYTSYARRMRELREEMERCTAESIEARLRLEELRRRHAGSIRVMTRNHPGDYHRGGISVVRFPRSNPPSRFAFYQGEGF